MIETIRELIEEARKRAKSHYTPSKERVHWTKLAGQLIWYKDQIIRSMGYDALEEEVAMLKEALQKKDSSLEQKTPRRTILKSPFKTKSGRRNGRR